MTDDEMIRFLTGLAAYVAELHERSRSEAGSGDWRPRPHPDSIPAEEENFCRWMGWRGPEEQEREIRNVRDHR